MKSVSIREARQKLAQLIAGAERGTSVLITRRGRTVAKLGPVHEEKSPGFPDLAAFRASLKSARKGRTATIQDLRQAERY